VNDIVTNINSDNVLCASFGLHPGYVAGILNSVKEIDLYVLCNKHTNYAEHIEKCIAAKESTFKLLAEHDFLLTSDCDSSNLV